jgi:[NiFe] hydrogenase assembly HybE family chaperone
MLEPMLEPCAADAVALLERHFAHIAATRMADLPLNNPALQVEAVAFCDWQGALVGVLIVPWAINLVVLPGRSAAFRALAVDEKQSWQFPSGEYQFMGGSDAAFGAYQFCSLFSPALEFTSHADARATAEEVMKALLTPLAETSAAAAATAETARLAGQPLLEQPISRRGFLRGGFLGKSNEA